MHTIRRTATALVLLAALGPSSAAEVNAAQVTLADYQRASALRAKYDALAAHVPDPASFVDRTNWFWYRRSVKGGHDFVLVDATTQAKTPAFDHDKLAQQLSKVLDKHYTGVTLPFTTFAFADNETSITMTIDTTRWKCRLSDYVCGRNDPIGGGRGGRGSGGQTDDRPRLSPDGKWEALINNYNIAIRAVGSRQIDLLSTDGSEGNAYTLASARWSPDSKRIAAYRVRPGYRREVHYVESSPEDQLQPKSSSLVYAKPGDVLDVNQPAIFRVDTKEQVILDTALFPNAYSLSELVWRQDGHALTFEYNQRGHQVYRVIEADAATGKTRAVISEEPKTFFNYRPANGNLADSGKKFRHDIDEGREIIWMSERDGWNHLYLYDGVTGKVKHQITKGDWVVRGVVKVDDEARQIWFSASGMYPGKDPYFLNYYRINFDGSGLTRLTEADANHAVAFSFDMRYFVDTYSRVDEAPVLELRRASDHSLVAEIEHGDISALRAAGGAPPRCSSRKAATARPTSGA